MSTASTLPAHLNSLSFSVTASLERRVDILTTITAIGLSSDGHLLAVGYQSGALEILDTDDYRTIRALNGGEKITVIVWSHMFPRQLFVGSKNGNIWIINIAQREAMDSKVQIFLDGYIQDIKLNDDGSQLAVCCGAAVVLFDKPTSEKRKMRTMYGQIKPNKNDVFETPIGVHFIDEFVVLAVFVCKAVAYTTFHPYDPQWEINSGQHAWMSHSAVSADKKLLVAGNLVDGLDRFSLIRKTRIANHDLYPSEYPQENITYTLAFIDSKALVAGHCGPCVSVIIDTGRNRGPNRYKIEYIHLRNVESPTHLVITGHIDEQPVIFAVNGSGADSTVYAISVQYSEDDQAPVIDIAPIIRSRFPILRVIGLALLIMVAYQQVKQAREVERVSERIGLLETNRVV